MSKKFDAWLDELEHKIIEGEFGYEPGEFTVYSTHWRPLFNQGLTPREAWQRALDGFANERRDEEGRKIANYARIVAEDQAAIAKQRQSNRSSKSRARNQVARHAARTSRDWV